MTKLKNTELFINFYCAHGMLYLIRKYMAGSTHYMYYLIINNFLFRARDVNSAIRAMQCQKEIERNVHFNNNDKALFPYPHSTPPIWRKLRCFFFCLSVWMETTPRIIITSGSVPVPFVTVRCRHSPLPMWDKQTPVLRAEQSAGPHKTETMHYIINILRYK